MIFSGFQIYNIQFPVVGVLHQLTVFYIHNQSEPLSAVLVTEYAPCSVTPGEIGSDAVYSENIFRNTVGLGRGEKLFGAAF